MAFLFVILILTEPRFACSGVLNPFLYARYIRYSAHGILYRKLSFGLQPSRWPMRREKEKPTRDIHTFDLATEITYYYSSTRDVTTELQLLASELDRMRLQVKSIKDSRFSLCMRMKAAITKQQCMQCHIETCCWETASRIKMST